MNDFSKFIKKLQDCKFCKDSTNKPDYAFEFFRILLGVSKYSPKTDSNENQTDKKLLLSNLYDSVSIDSLKKMFVNRPIPIDLRNLLRDNINAKSFNSYISNRYKKNEEDEENKEKKDFLNPIRIHFGEYINDCADEKLGNELITLFKKILSNHDNNIISAIFIEDKNENLIKEYNDSLLKANYGKSLLLEFENRCACCNKSLYKRNKVFDYYILRIDPINGDEVSNLVPLCRECGIDKIINPELNVNELLNAKEKAHNKYTSDQILDSFPMQKDIINGLSTLANELRNNQDEIYSSMQMISLKDKINGNALFVRKISYLSSCTYNDINDALRYLEISDLLRSIMRCLYLSIKDKFENQEDLFLELTKFICNKGVKETSLSEAIVAFFIRDCEVFEKYEPTK